MTVFTERDLEKMRVRAENRRKAYAIRWLEFELPHPALRETFGALRELFADEHVTTELRAALLDKWLDRSWRQLAPWGDEKCAHILAAARALGLIIPKFAEEKYGGA